MSLIFDGTGDYGVTSAVFGTNSQMSMSIWIYKPTGHGNVQWDMWADIGSGNYDRSMFLAHDETAGGGFPNGAVGSVVNGVSSIIRTDQFDNDAWTHWVITSDRTGPSNKIYKNGALVGTEDTTITRELFTAGVQLTVGANNGTTGNIEGNIGQLCIWEGAILTAGEVSDLYNGGSGGNGVNPSTIQNGSIVSYYPLTADANDSIGSNNITLYGNASIDTTLDPPVDAAGGGTVISRTLSDSTGVSDGQSDTYHLFELLQSSLPVTDNITLSILAAEIQRTLSDSVDVTDDLAKVFYLTRALSEQTNISDALTLEYIRLKVLTASLGVTDSLAVSLGKVLTQLLSDNLTLSDNIVLTHDVTKLVLSSLLVTDEIVNEFNLGRLLSDNVDIEDALNRFILALLERVLSDSLNLSDSLTASLVQILIQAVRAQAGINLKSIDIDASLLRVVVKANKKDISYE